MYGAHNSIDEHLEAVLTKFDFTINQFAIVPHTRQFYAAHNSFDDLVNKRLRIVHVNSQHSYPMSVRIAKFTDATFLPVKDQKELFDTFKNYRDCICGESHDEKSLYHLWKETNIITIAT